MEKIASNLCFGGEQLRYKHLSEVLNCSMHFSVFLPLPGAQLADAGKFPILYWLSGLSCNDENFVQKAGAQRIAAELGLMIVCPDTSPRGDYVPDDPDQAYDFGLGAGFYLNATEPPWNQHYKMLDYIQDELPRLIEANFPANAAAQSIFGHSMGGHGALTIALKNPTRFRSVSAFAPVVSPINCPWGTKALSNYLGDHKQAWQQYDACSLIAKATRSLPMLIDQGSKDQFLLEQLKPELMIKACGKAGYPLTYNLRPGYDHSYFFIATFIEEHLRFHHRHLLA